MRAGAGGDERAAAAGQAGVTAAFLLGSHLATARLAVLAAAELPPGELIDAILSPLPADPLCWDVLRLSREGDAYVARRAVIALVPALLPASACRDTTLASAGPPRWSPAAGSDARALRWREYSMPRAVLAGLARQHCEAAAFLQFARAPFVEHDADGELLGDLRFDGARGGRFAQLRVGAADAAAPCAFRAPWVAPRAALLSTE